MNKNVAAAARAQIAMCAEAIMTLLEARAAGAKTDVAAGCAEWSNAAFTLSRRYVEAKA